MVGLSDKAAFYNVLANARLYQLKELTGTFVQKSDSLSLANQNRAIRSLTEKMKDPKYQASDEMIGAVSSFMCHHVSHCSSQALPWLIVWQYILGNFEGWEVHRDAMARAAALRGGINSITNESLRITVSW